MAGVVPRDHIFDFTTNLRPVRRLPTRMPLGRGLNRDWPPAQGGHEKLSYGSFQPFAHRFAVHVAIGRNGVAVSDKRVDYTPLDERLDVRHEIEIAVPGNQGPMLASHRKAMLPDVCDGHRLHQNTSAAALVLDRTEQRGAEWQDAVAVARCAFGEEHDGSP